MKEGRWQEIERLYNSALERSPEEREAFLRQACGDASLRREIESLLACRSEKRSSTGTPAIEAAGQVFARDHLNPSPSLPAGSSLSHYRILEKLGRGGMGEVYRAEDTNVRRHVAIKLLPEEFARDPERVARFQREARALASLNHPNIATLHGFEESDAKRFIVMELVEGPTLAQRLLKGPLPMEELKRLAPAR